MKVRFVIYQVEFIGENKNKEELNLGLQELLILKI